MFNIACDNICANIEYKGVNNYCRCLSSRQTSRSIEQAGKIMINKQDMLLKKPIQYLKGVGEARALLFHRLGIFTIGDIITHYPRDYEDRSKLKKIAELLDGEQCSFEGIITSKPTETRPRKGLLLSKAVISDGTGFINAVWFNQGYLKNSLKQGEKYIFYGTIIRKRTLEIVNPVFEKVNGTGQVNTCRIVPVYPSTGKLSQNMIRGAIRSALELAGEYLEEALPEWILTQYGLADVQYSINNIHYPQNDDAFMKARERLVFEEFLLLQLGLLCRKDVNTAERKGITFNAGSEVHQFIDLLPFRLTNAQKRVFSEIEKDMESDRIMNRLVQGDVGSGKTVVAVLALFKAAKSGYQGALMAPTEILAKQHYTSIAPMLEPLGIKTVLLTGSTAPKEAKTIIEEISCGLVDLVIGTHALLEDRVVFKNLGLVVTDEQHRFGVRQRAVLSQKGENPDMLVMTATPIPRTLALILYGDLDISIIDELPPGRKKVETYVVDNSMRERINKFIRKQVAEGRQVYIVCPMVEESDTVEAQSATELAEQLAYKTFSDLRVALVHGKMKPAEKESVMTEFAAGRTDILVSTTVIEVGVNVPNASLMVVENAERFGLAQLHQLRGRVGRGEYSSYCILFNEGKTDVSRERMLILSKTSDGFVISEKDLELRGPGDFFGTRQHGIPELKIANLYKDVEILKKAQKAAEKIITSDRKLEGKENQALNRAVKVKFSAVAENLSMN